MKTMKRKITLICASLLAGAFCASAGAQNYPGPIAPVPVAHAPMFGSNGLNPANGNQGFGQPITQTGYNNLNTFLASHPDLSGTLSRNPQLINDPNFIATHPDLQSYLASHPTTAGRLRQHPDQFMHRDRDDLYHWNEATGSRPYVTDHATDNMNTFLASHPDVASSLSHNPQLINNQQFLAAHPELKSYLASHPGVDKQFTSRPDRFMDRAYGDGKYGNPESYKGTAVNADHYLDNHPEIQSQLQQNPELVKNTDYLNNHPGLQQYLANHPYVRSQYQNHPYKFENRLKSLEKHAGHSG